MEREDRFFLTPLSPLAVSYTQIFRSDGTYSSPRDQIGTFEQSGREGEAGELIERGVGLGGRGFWQL